MKKTVLILLVMVFTIQLQAQFTKASLQASGLTCSMCNNAIYKALKALPFIASVESDIKNASFDMVFKQDVPADIDAIKDAVEDAGFSVATFKITGNFDNINIADDKHVVIGNRHFHFVKVKDQVLNGEQTITVIDKDFLSVKNFKKFSTATKKGCILTGKADGVTEGISKDTRIYHVTI